jgi:hypothetical protein
MISLKLETLSRYPQGSSHHPCPTLGSCVQLYLLTPPEEDEVGPPSTSGTHSTGEDSEGYVTEDDLPGLDTADDSASSDDDVAANRPAGQTNSQPKAYALRTGTPVDDTPVVRSCLGTR